MRHILVIFFLFSFIENTFTQTICPPTSSKRANNWYFGANAGITFNTNPPTSISNGALNTGEGTATISDDSGNILFYTDGINVYNKNHVLMANGTGLAGNSSSTQSGVIIPDPSSSNKFYILTAAEYGSPNVGFNYSQVDLSLNGGLGAVTTKNTLLFSPSSEKVTSVVHANGKDIWVIGHESGTNTFHAYLISSTGVNTTPVNSSLGVVYGGAGSETNVGYMKFSPDGKKVAVAVGSFGSGKIEIFDFNNLTGQLSNPISFAPEIAGEYPYGIEFSPDGNLLYVSTLASATSGNLYQYNLNSGSKNATDIKASVKTIFSKSGYAMCAIQLGPDGKIYVAKSVSYPPNGENYLGVINSPNLIGAISNYVDQGVFLGTRKSFLGLPTFIQSYFIPQIPNFNFQDTCFTNTVKFTLSNITDTTNISWNFGDGTTSTKANPNHVYATKGPKTVTLTYKDPCAATGFSTITKTLHIVGPSLNLSDTTVCILPIILNAQNSGAAYLWSTGETTQTISVNSSGKYQVTVTENSCSVTDSLVVIENLNRESMADMYLHTASSNPAIQNLDFSTVTKNLIIENHATDAAIIPNSNTVVPNAQNRQNVYYAGTPITAAMIVTKDRFSMADFPLVVEGEFLNRNGAAAHNESYIGILPSNYLMYSSLTYNPNDVREEGLIIGRSTLGGYIFDNQNQTQGERLVINRNFSQTPPVDWLKLRIEFDSSNGNLVVNTATLGGMELFGTYPVTIGALSNYTWLSDFRVALCPDDMVSYLSVGKSNFSYYDTCFTNTTQFVTRNIGDTTNLTWNFGDGTTSTKANPNHVYATKGPKTVTLTYKDPCAATGFSTITKTLHIVGPSLNLSDTIVCSLPITLDAQNPGATYLWNTNANTQTISATTFGKYKVKVTLDGCSVSDSLLVISQNGIDSTIFLEDFRNDLPAIGSRTTLANWNVLQGDVDVWPYMTEISTTSIDLGGLSNAIIESKNTINLEPGKYIISFYAKNNTHGGNSLNLSIGTVFNKNFPSPTNTTFLKDSFVVNSTELAKIKFTQLGPNDNGGTFIGEIILKSDSLNNKPNFIYQDTCYGETVNFISNNIKDTTNLSWNFGDGSTSTKANPTHIYATKGSKTVTLTYPNPCSATGFSTLTKTITIIGPILKLADTTVCSVPIILDAKNSGATYLWNTNANTQTISATTFGKYKVAVTLGACTVSDSMLVKEVSGENKTQNIWHFGFHSALDFNGGSPTVISTSQIDATNGASSISDASGNILFYTNGTNVWNKNNQLMDNGTGLSGNVSYFQNSLIIPFNNDPDKYYLFTNGTTGMKYSVVDMSQNAGLGKVITKDITIQTSTSMRMAGVSDGDSTVWVATFDAGGSIISAYKVLPSSVSISPVNSNTGIGSCAGRGNLKFSQDGTKAAYTCTGNSQVVVMDFDKKTGLFSNTKAITGNVDLQLAYDVEFSPDKSKLYISTQNGNKLIQYTLAGDNSASNPIVISQVASTYYNALKTGPDGKIYVTLSKGVTNTNNSLSVIENPNELGIASNYQHMFINLGTNTGNYSFPNMIANASTSDAISYKNNCQTPTAQFFATAKGASPKFHWDFGILTSTIDTSNLQNPTFTFPTFGTYTVSCRITTQCYDTTLTGIVSIDANPIINLKDTNVCVGPILLNAGNSSASYIWSTGENTQTITVDSTNKYSVTATTQGGCFAQDSALVTIANPTIGNFTYSDTCLHSITKFNLVGIADTSSISWDFGDGSSSIKANPTHEYNLSGLKTVTLNYNNACLGPQIATKTLHILASDSVSLIASKDTICFGESVTFTATYSGSSNHPKSWTVNTLLQVGQNGLTFATNSLPVGIDSVKFKVNPTGIVSCPANLTAIKKIVVNPIKNISNTPLNVLKNPICPGDTMHFSTKPQNAGPAVLIWTVNGVASDTTFEPNYIFKKSGLLEGDVIKFILTSQNKCFTPQYLPSTDSIIVKVIPNVSPAVSINSTTNPVCIGESVIVKAHPVYGGNSPLFQWAINGTDTGSLTTDSNFVSNSIQNNDEVKVKIKSNYVCLLKDTASSNKITFNVQSAFAPTIAIKADTTQICKDKLIYFSIDSISGGGTNPSVTWQVNSITKSNLPNFSNSNFTNNDIVTATVTSNANCANPKTANSNSISITVYPKPVINLLDSYVFCDEEQSSITIDASSSGIGKYRWSTGDSIPSINVATAGFYKLSISNSQNCINTDSTQVIINCEPRVFIPSAFSPNSDGKNDHLEIFSLYTTSFNIKIFNRWGELIFDSNDASKGWKGLYRGEQVPQGTYNYICTYNGLFNGKEESRTLRGDITIIE